MTIDSFQTKRSLSSLL